MPHVLWAFTCDLNVSGSCRAHRRSRCAGAKLSQAGGLSTESTATLDASRARRGRGTGAGAGAGAGLGTLVEMTKSLGVQSEPVELDICRKEEKGDRLGSF